ncbi:MAG: hypothetical protein WBA57_26510 [Elainellaceae cyanobacterium]
MTSSQILSPTLFETNTLDGSPAYPLRLWQVGVPATTIPSETIVVIHGRQSEFDESGDRPPLAELYPRLYGLAATLAQSPSTQILFVDAQQALTDPSLPPYDAAGRIQLVADWAASALQGIPNLTIIGHSLGTYVAAEVAAQLEANRLIALDPAFPGQNYDVDESEPGQQPVRDFKASAQQSLAFVVADGLFQLGLAGDNQQAGTAETSLVAKFDGLGGIFDANEAHGAVVDLYADLSLYLNPGATPFDDLWQSLSRDRYDNSGDRRTGLHEGVAYADRDEDDVWRLERIDGDGQNFYFISEALGNAESLELDDGAEHNTLITLIDYTLDDAAHDLILGGYDDLSGTGNSRDNNIWGNTGNNQISGSGGDDTIRGDLGADILIGNAGADHIWGNHDDDIIVGSAGNDVLMGGAKDDLLQGDRGNDVMIGGLGADIFVLQAMAGIDTIEDFNLSVDRFFLADGLVFEQLTLTQQSTGVLIRQNNTSIAEVLGVTVEALNLSTVFV